MRIQKTKSIILLFVLVSPIILNYIEEIDFSFLQVNNKFNRVKATDTETTLLWNKTWKDDVVYSLAVDSNDILYGTGGDRLYKFNPSGDTILNITSPPSSDHYSYRLCLDSSENIYIAGDACLSKFTNDGIELWNFTWHTPGGDLWMDIATDSNDDLYIWGTYEADGINPEYLLMKFDKLGNFMWNLTWRYPILRYYPNSAVAFYIDHLDNIYCAASSQDIGGDVCALHLYKFNTSGGLIWDVKWETPNFFYNEYDIICDTLGNIYIAGGRTDFFLLKYDSSGSLQWEITSSPSDIYETVAIELDDSGNIYCGGTIWYQIDSNYYYDIGLWMYNSDGVLQCSYQWRSNNQNYFYSCFDIVLDSTYGLYLSGYSSGSSLEFFLLKFKIPSMFDILYPNSDQVFGRTSPSFGIEKLVSNIDCTWYSLNHIGKYFFTGENGIINESAWESLGTGNVTIIFYANNTLGKIDFQELTLYKDLIPPNLDIIEPIPYRLYGNVSPSFSIIADSPDLEEVWYTVDNGLNNYTIIGNSGFLDQTAWESCSNGTVDIIFYAKDVVENIASETIQVYKDISAPCIKINLPEASKLYGRSLDYDLDLFGVNIDKIWYTLNDGQKNFILSEVGTISGSIWEDCEDGLVNIKFFINDTISKETFTEIDVNQDTTDPKILILEPIEDQFFSDAPPSFNLSVLDVHPDSTWYSLDGGMKNFTISGNSGTVDFNAWNSSKDGIVVLSFYANDSVCNFGSNEITLNKDTIQPNITINAPVLNKRFLNQVPQYNVTISDANLNQKWYRINDGSATYFTSDVDYINATQWGLCNDGYVNISFYAIDFAGNMVHDYVIVRKNIATREAYAIIIGISDYPGNSNDLQYCDDDAIAVYNMLISDYNFRPENIIYLQDSSASKADIDNAFDTIISSLESEDIFFFYYSGHGGRGTYSSQNSWNVETYHPYWNNDDRIWSTPSISGAIYMRIHFVRFQTEYYYDFALGGSWSVTQGYYYEEFTGDLGYNFWSSYIPVSRYYLRFISDFSTTAWGFEIDKYEAILEDGTHFLCSYDSIPNNPSSYYLDTLIDSKLDQINCGEKYVIVDACNSGGLIPEVQDIGRYIMTACRNSEESLETPLLEHGIFTHFLLEAEENANDQNADGVLSMEECYDYVYSNTVSYSGNFGSEYTHHPQEYDGILGESVLKPAIGSVEINIANNTLGYSFYLYGHGNIKTLNLTYCSLEPSINLVTQDIRFQNDETSGFGYYSGTIYEEEGVILGGIRLVTVIEGNQEITIEILFGDSDGDGLTDLYEILYGNGLDPTSNDTDNDGLDDNYELYGDTDPLDNDTDNDGLLDGEEVLFYLTSPLLNDTDSDNLSDYDEIFDFLTNPLLNDTDFDNLNDYDEIFDFLTNPLLNDTDFDNLNDYDEIFIHHTDPLNPDTDQDGLSDYDELIIYGTNSTNADTDSDSIPDGWEIDNLLDPFINDSALDPDNDSLTNLEEFQYNTFAQNNDSDSDGLLDGEEVFTYNTDPLDNDSDSDGLLDGEEVLTYNTDPLDNDSDSDLMPDKWEVDNNLNPLVNDTTLDPDTDGLTNIEEYQNNTNPQDSDTDNDGWDDGTEVSQGTDPLDPEDHPNPPQSPTIPGYDYILLFTLVAVISKVLIKKKY